MISNNVLNFTSKKIVSTTNNDSKKNSNIKIPEKYKVYDKNDPYFDYLKEDHSFEGTAKEVNKADRKIARDALLASLIAISSIAAPISYGAYCDSQNEEKYKHLVAKPFQISSKEDSLIVAKAGELAKEGKRSDVLETQEFMKLLDYSKLEGLPKSTRETIKITSKSMYIPIDMNSPDAEEQILRHVKDAQSSIDKVSEDIKKNPTKSYREMYMEYAMNNITDQEILDNVDFSELAQYQYDIGLVKGLINFSREKIKRNEADSDKKYEKAVKDAQSLVDGIVNKYKTRAKVSGNYNGDEILSKGELATLLDLKPLEGLPDQIKYGIIAKAIENYKPIELRYATDKQQVELANEKVKESKEKAQDILNQWAFKAQRQFWHLTHPNEVIRMNRD